VCGAGRHSGESLTGQKRRWTGIRDGAERGDSDGFHTSQFESLCLAHPPFPQVSVADVRLLPVQSPSKGPAQFPVFLPPIVFSRVVE